MKSLLAVLISIAVFSGFAIGASLDEAYVASRDRYIAKFAQLDKAGKIDDRVQKDEELARGDLEKQLRRIIGPVEIKGFPADGKINVEDLFPGNEDFGRLDGLVYSSADNKARVVATTDALLKSWLHGHRNWWPGLTNVPQDIDRALKSEAFYTQALSTDAAIDKYAEIPVTAPAKARFAFAMLVARSQDIGPSTPNELIISVVAGTRVFVISAATEAAINPIPVCDDVWQDSERKAEAIDSAPAVSEHQDQSRSEKLLHARDEGAHAFARCFAERARTESFFPALVEQTKGLVQRLPSR